MVTVERLHDAELIARVQMRALEHVRREVDAAYQRGLEDGRSEGPGALVGMILGGVMTVLAYCAMNAVGLI